MFHKRNDTVYTDLSVDLRDPDDWKVGALRSFDYPLNITALATEPVSRLLAVGTAEGLVYIFGGPGVETRLALPQPVGVKFVHFATSTFQLVCMDVNSQLHIWDLSSYGRPDFLISVRFDPANFLTLSPSHNHLFVSLNSGEIKTYDLACLRKSPYTVPNMWRLYEREISATGAPDMSTPESCSIVETVTHPRDLNLLFVAYSGGIVLSDLTKRHAIRAFELLLPPGAPGGSGYGDRDLLTHRKFPVTAMAIHPTGHFFVVGHTDGSLAFWAVDDDERPLLVRTLDAIDVNIVDMQILDEHISQERPSKHAHTDREPIFKLSWSALSGSSDSRGGETTLTILGGLQTNQATGITVYLFPAFNPPDPPEPTSTADQQRLHPYLRTAMRDSLNHLKSFFYYTRGTVQDYLLIPRESPHFSGTSDPIAIMLLTEGDGDTRIVEAYQYPPPEFSSSIDVEEGGETYPEENEGVPVEALGDVLASTLRSLQISDEPKRLWLPSAIMNGSTGLLTGQLLTVETAIYKTLVDEAINDALYLPLKGGVAWADDTQKTELKLAKHQPHRLVITYHLNLTIQFHDISAQLLDGLNPTPIKSNFPNSLPALTIDLKPLLMDTIVSKRTSPTTFNHTRIDSVSLAQELQEVVVVLQTGEVVVYQLSSLRMASPPGEAPNESLLLLDHVLTQPEDRFSPYFMLTPGAGPVEAYALSDLGFLAVAYSGRLYIVGMKGPHILLRHVQDMTTKRHSIGLHLGRSEPPHIRSLLWTVGSLEEDSHSRIRLIAQYTSGRYDIYTLTPSGGSMLWTCEGPISAEGVLNPLPQGGFVIDCKSGKKWKAPHCAFVTCGSKGAKCFANINGTQIAKTDWGSKIGVVQGAQIVERLGSHVLVVFTDQYRAIVYSLPHLELLHTLSLPAVPSRPICMDESGDFMAWIPHSLSGTIERAIYCTLFDIRRVSVLPGIDLLCTKPVVPSQPQPVSMGPSSLLASWLPFNQSMTGDQLDTILGGPDRPLPKPERLPQSSTGTSSMATAATAAATQGTNLYNRLAATLSERGQLLGDLENRFNALEEGSKSMVAQAKRLATQHTAKQTAKSWFG